MTFKTIKKMLMIQDASKDQKDVGMKTNFHSIHILYRKTIQHDILSIGWHLLSLKNKVIFYSRFKNNAENI